MLIPRVASSLITTTTQMADELAEINGIKPDVSFAEGEEKEVGSVTRQVGCVLFIA